MDINDHINSEVNQPERPPIKLPPIPTPDLLNSIIQAGAAGAEAGSKINLPNAGGTLTAAFGGAKAGLDAARNEEIATIEERRKRLDTMTIGDSPALAKAFPDYVGVPLKFVNELSSLMRAKTMSDADIIDEASAVMYSEQFNAVLGEDDTPTKPENFLGRKHASVTKQFGEIRKATLEKAQLDYRKQADALKRVTLTPAQAEMLGIKGGAGISMSADKYADMASDIGLSVIVTKEIGAKYAFLAPFVGKKMPLRDLVNAMKPRDSFGIFMQGNSNNQSPADEILNGVQYDKTTGQPENQFEVVK